MTTDKELLELAAQACGITGSYVENHKICGDCGVGRYTGILISKDQCWNPLVDAGDTFYLAAYLRISLRYNEFADTVTAYNDLMAQELSYEDDVASAAQRAVVLVAAEVGRGLK